MEKREGVADRGAVTGIKFGHIVVASFVSDSFMIVGQIAVFFIVLPGFYGMKVVIQVRYRCVSEKCSDTKYMN